MVEVIAKAMSLVFLPFALINVSIFMKKATKVIGFVVVPVALVKTTVWPDLDAFTFTDLCAHTPLTYIARAIVKANHRATL